MICRERMDAILSSTHMNDDRQMCRIADRPALDIQPSTSAVWQDARGPIWKNLRRNRLRYQSRGAVKTQQSQAALTSFFRTSVSAICTVLSAAPLRRLSETTHIDKPFLTVGSFRIRLT